MKPSWRNLQTAVGLIGFFVVLAIAAGPTKAALATLSIVVAYLVEFYVLRTAIRLLALKGGTLKALLVSALAITAGAILIYLHFALVLGTAIACLSVMDAVLLRFRYTPIE